MANGRPRSRSDGRATVVAIGMLRCRACARSARWKSGEVSDRVVGVMVVAKAGTAGHDPLGEHVRRQNIGDPAR